jgi:hypothetical protein
VIRVAQAIIENGEFTGIIRNHERLVTELVLMAVEFPSTMVKLN